MDQHIPHIDAFTALGEFLRTHKKGKGDQTHNSLEEVIQKASLKNPWFTSENCEQALQWWSECLIPERISSWLSTYKIPAKQSKTVALVMAGNIPLVGFHDLLCVLLSGHKALIKLSSKDYVLLPFLLNYLIEQD
ncbi:MAG: acyl-CoA reductase, partial [Eudoraea sp.]|nr:acyl-CoA reductase [Eudoraea sp.]